jgi:medium-chain acyl-[acyl-carrier-protein] hydrolase
MFEKQFKLRYFEMDQFGEATPTTVLKLLEEAAAEHCLSINQSLYDLFYQNIGWVLLSGYMQMERYPLYKEKITIRTWISKHTSIRGNRENLIFDEQGKIIGRAKGLWLFYDIKKRMPVRIFDDILKKWGCFPEESITHDITKKIEAIDSGIYKRNFLVHRYDMDANKHVNNLRYLQWLIETIPDEIMDNFYMHSIDGRYLNEAQFGHTIESLSEPEDGAHNFIHTIKDLDNNQVCSTGRTVWRTRGSRQI